MYLKRFSSQTLLTTQHKPTSVAGAATDKRNCCSMYMYTESFVLFKGLY